MPRTRAAKKESATALVGVEVKHGDAFDLLASLAPSSIDLLLTSPPYWGHRTYSAEHNWDILSHWKATGAAHDAIPNYEWYRQHGGVLGLEPLPEWYVSHLVEFFERARHSLKPSASMWINIGDTYFARWSSIRQQGRQGLGDNARERRRTPMGGFRQQPYPSLSAGREPVGPFLPTM